jgi:acetyltransferase
MAKLFEKFSPETVYFRFFSAMRSMPIDRLKKFCDIDYENQMALVACSVDNGDETLLGVARYVLLPEQSRSAEFAVVVADAWQNRRIGTNLLQRLVDVAKQQGIETFVGLVMDENRKALGIIRNSGYKFKESAYEPGIRRVEFTLSDIDPSLRVVKKRAT